MILMPVISVVLKRLNVFFVSATDNLELRLKSCLLPPPPPEVSAITWPVAPHG